jgi:hypothetical protein
MDRETATATESACFDSDTGGSVESRKSIRIRIFGSALTKGVLVLTSAVFAWLYVSISPSILFHLIFIDAEEHTGLARLGNVDHLDDWGLVDVYVCRSRGW